MEKESLGRVLALHGSYLQDWLLHDSDFNWRVEPEYGGASRAVADIGTHWMDCIEYLTGLRISQVFADFATVHPVRRKPKTASDTFSRTAKSEGYENYTVASEDWAEILLRFENGMKAVFLVSQISAGRKNRLFFEVSGSKQSAAWDSEEPNKLWLGRRESENGLVMKDPSLFDADAKQFCDYPGGHQEGYPDTFKYLFREFYAAVRSKSSGESKKSFPTFRDGLRQVRLCDAIVKSSEKGKWTKIPG
jgi:predicted dehydrogenase